MNAKVYIGSDNYAAAVPLITKITGSNYALHTNYNQLFLIMIKMELKMNLFLPLRLTVFIHKLMVELS
jgi:hypothetical protein